MIPARGGSKGVHRKNLQQIGGIPLVGRAVLTALGAESVDRVYVSTEDGEIALVAQQYGATVIDRPKKLAEDQTATHPVIKHATEVIQPAPDTLLVVLECTYPLAISSDIDQAVRQFQADPDVNVLTTVCCDHSYQVRAATDGVEWVTFQRADGDQRRQDLPETFKLSGGITVYRAAEHRMQTCGFYGTVRLCEIPEERAIDIDTPLDLHVAKAMVKYQSQWIVIGSSPSAPEGLRAARSAYPDARTITTNSSANLFTGKDRPDVYHLHDSIACKEHQEDARRFAALGSHLTTLDRTNHSALVGRKVDWFDEFLPLVNYTHPGRFQQGVYASCGLSGLMILQYALNNGAKGVHIVGQEGYADKDHYFDASKPDLGMKKGLAFTRDQIGPFIQSCVDACPDVHFTFYGNLNYPIADGSNVTFVKDLPKCSSNSNIVGEASGPATSGICQMARQTS